LARRFAEIIEPLRDGSQRITSVVEVAKVLTAENGHEVLPKFFQQSKRDAMALAAAMQPSAAPHRDVITSPDATSTAAVGAAVRYRTGRGGSTG
jgi:hypothetical protein